MLFVIDARAGVTPADEHFAQILRVSGKPVVLVANKGESRAGEGGVLEAYALGFGEPLAVSAEHGLGIPDITDAIREAMPKPEGDALGSAGEHGEDVRKKTPRRNRFTSPSSGSRMRGNRHCSIGCSARSGC